MKGSLLLILFNCLLFFNSYSQQLTPLKINEVCINTIGIDYFNSATLLKNKNYIISGFFGDKNFLPNQPDTFCHLLLVDSNFNLIKAVKSPMFAHEIFENEDGSLTLVGTTKKLYDSRNVFNDIHGNNIYQPDIALMKINSSLDSIMLTKAIGGTGEDSYLSGIVRTNDNGIIFSAATRSTNGDIPGNRPCLNNFTYDAFLCKTDSNFNIQWLKIFEGENGELAMGELIEIKDDVFRVDIRSSSSQCDFANTKPFNGVFKSLIVLFDANGNILKRKIYDDENDMEWKIGGWHQNDTTIMIGYASSKNTYAPSFPIKDKVDFAITLYDTNFNIIGMKLWGGLSNDVLIDYLVHDNYIYVMGITSSNDSLSDIKGYHGGSCDYYLAKLDMNFNVIWSRTVGSSGKDCSFSNLPFPLRKMFINNQNQLVFLFEIYGPNTIPDGDVTCAINKDPSNPSEFQDAWIVKFDLNTATNVSLEKSINIKSYPNPIQNSLTIESNSFNFNGSNLKIYDLNGRIVYEKIVNENVRTIQIDMNEIENSSRMYFLVLEKNGAKVYSEKLLLN